jgi:hypothetical protein
VAGLATCRVGFTRSNRALVEYAAGGHSSSLGCEVRGCEVWRGGLHAFEFLLSTPKFLACLAQFLLHLVGLFEPTANGFSLLRIESNRLIVLFLGEEFDGVLSVHLLPRTGGKTTRRNSTCGTLQGGKSSARKVTNYID